MQDAISAACWGSLCWGAWQLHRQAHAAIWNVCDALHRRGCCERGADAGDELLRCAAAQLQHKARRSYGVVFNLLLSGVLLRLRLRYERIRAFFAKPRKPSQRGASQARKWQENVQVRAKQRFACVFASTHRQQRHARGRQNSTTVVGRNGKHTRKFLLHPPKLRHTQNTHKRDAHTLSSL